jgi:hypothetical protein
MGLTRLHRDENNILSFQQIAMNDNNQKTACGLSQVQMICKNGSQGCGSHLPDVQLKRSGNDAIKRRKILYGRRQI